MSSYFRPDPFGAVFLRLAGTDRDVRRPELFFPKKNPSISHYAPALIERRHSNQNHLATVFSILFCQPICNSLRLVQDALLVKSLERAVLHENLSVDHDRIDR